MDEVGQLVEEVESLAEKMGPRFVEIGKFIKNDLVFHCDRTETIDGAKVGDGCASHDPSYYFSMPENALATTKNDGSVTDKHSDAAQNEASTKRAHQHTDHVLSLARQPFLTLPYPSPFSNPSLTEPLR